MELLQVDMARQALQEGRGKGIKVAIIDSGVEWTHPKLVNVTQGDDLAIFSDGLQVQSKPGEGRDVFGHGTAIAGIIHSLAPEATLGSFRVLDGWLESKTKIIAEGFRLAFEGGYHVVNCSIGSGARDHIFEYKSIVDHAYLNNVHLVCACNNEEYTMPEWPGNFTSPITVNMVNTINTELFWFKRGNLVEFFAAGVNVDVAWRGNGLKQMTGSSYATPLVTGMVARLLSVMPNLTPLELKAVLQKVAQPLPSDLHGPNMRWSE